MDWILDSGFWILIDWRRFTRMWRLFFYLFHHLHPFWYAAHPPPPTALVHGHRVLKYDARVGGAACAPTLQVASGWRERSQRQVKRRPARPSCMHTYLLRFDVGDAPPCLTFALTSTGTFQCSASFQSSTGESPARPSALLRYLRDDAGSICWQRS